ncbi:DNA helicase [Tanacetum coccineum]
MFAMTSFGAKVDDSINRGRGPYVFKYEVENRMRNFGEIDDSNLDSEIVEGLIHFLDVHNELVQLFRTARDKCREIDIPEFKIRLYNTEGARGYELPTSNTLGAVVFYSGVTGSTDFDVIIQEKDGPAKRTSKLHKYYMSFQFPLLFIYGQSRFHTELKLKLTDGSRNERRVTMRAYYAYQLHPWQNRLDFIQGPRYMYVHYLDALAICRKLEGNLVLSIGAEQFWMALVISAYAPAVQILSVHLKGMQRVTFIGRDRLESVVNLPGRKNTTLTEWLAYNEANEDGRHLTYLNFPSELMWYDNHKSWSPRRNSRSSFVRLAYVHPTSGELFYFRMLLYHQKGCKDFLEVQTVHDIFYPTYRATCEALGFLGDDNEWDIAMQEACVPAMSSQLRFVFAHILTHCEELIFVYSHGSTGKTFLWKTIISTLRCEGKIVLAAASFGIASLLLPSGQIAHSRFKLPIELSEESLCKVTKNSQLGKLLADTDLIIWDEAPMNDRHFYYFRREDFRQTLPVKKGASKIEIIASCISQSELWLHFKVFILKENMRLSKPGVSADERNLISSFASWLLDIGDGKTGEPDQEDPENTNWIHIPLTCCLPDVEQGLSKLIDFIYDQMTLRTPSAITLQKKANVCPKNETANMINSKVLEMVQGEMTTYLSHDEAIPPECNRADTEMLYHVEHLNTLKFLGFPPHRLELKMGEPVMLLRNVNVVVGLSTTSMELLTFAQLTPNSHEKIIEARVYRKWIGKSLLDLTPNAFCCILLDQEGTAIQANMNLGTLTTSTRSWK